MIGKLNHVAIAVPDLAAASHLYRDILGAEVSAPVDQPAYGVTTVFVSLPGSCVELIHPLGKDSPVAAFLARRPAGGIHHICYEVRNIGQAIEQLTAQGIHVIGKDSVRRGAHGRKVVFLHPADCCGTLIELEEAP